MIDPNYIMQMAQGGYIDEIYTELQVFETEDHLYRVYKVEPEEEYLAEFEQLEWAEEFAINYFN